MESLKNKIVCVTGASSGIGAACATEFARQGSALLLMARRKDRIVTLAADLSTTFAVRTLPIQLDVTRRQEVDSTFAALPRDWKKIDILVNNAGLSRGLTRIHEGHHRDWEEMIDTNIKGLLFVTRAVLPDMVKRNEGHIINIGSIAGHQVYPNGNVYCATKHAVDALTQGMRLDLLGTAVRVTSVDPGLVETEFSQVRFHGDTVRAAQTYANTVPLRAEDIAEVIVFCATRPPHVDVSDVIVMPTAQASVNHLHRTSS
jgi:3-hydroxy acid dehydrogenase/malonic semialdehyde reductase